MRQMQQMQAATTYNTAPGTAVVIVHAFAEEKPLKVDRSLRVDLTNLGNHIGGFLVVPGHGDAVFVSIALGKYAVSVTAVGYLTTRQEISVLKPQTQEVDIVIHRDPAAVSLNEASGLLSKKAKKEANRALSSLKSGRLPDAQKHLEAAYKLAPSNADLNFLFGYLYFEEQDYVKAGSYLRTAASLSPHSAQTLILLGRTNLAQHDYPAAQSALEQATLVDSENWLPHNLLADSYLHQKEYGRARDEAQIALAKSAKYGKDASGAAQLTLGQALLALGQNKEGIQALHAFLKQSPPANLVEQVRALITLAEKNDRASAAPSENAVPLVDPLTAVPKVALSMQTWRPPDIDDAKPILEPGVTCPAAQVLAGAGQRVQDLVQDVTRFSAKEDLFHKSLDGVGLSNSAETRRYDYVAAISSQPGSVLIDEYRSEIGAQHGDPDGIASTGFAMLALIFHPAMQGDFNFDCEGRGQWSGQPSWLIHFRQREDRPNHMHSYSVGGKSYQVDLKGRAWISSDTFQIVHMEADMAKPLREIQLASERQIVEYGPVPFANKNTMLWLPKNVEIYLDFRKHHYYRRYSFDHYMLFDVNVTENQKSPTESPASSATPSAKTDFK